MNVKQSYKNRMDKALSDVKQIRRKMENLVALSTTTKLNNKQTKYLNKLQKDLEDAESTVKRYKTLLSKM